MMRIRCIILLLAVLAGGCSKNDELIGEQHNGELVSSTFTKGTGDGKAYRICLNGIVGTETENIETSGSYCDLTEGLPFVPCNVDESGKFTSANDAMGLRAKDGPYKMHIVYPAINGKPIPYDGYTHLTGYLLERNITENSDQIYLSTVKDVTVNGTYLKEPGSQLQYIYDASAIELKQQRSRIKIIFKCGEDIESTTLQNIVLKNIISQGYYRPVDGIFYYQDSNIENKEVYDTPLTLTTGNSKDLEIDEYILSMNYGELDGQGNTKWPLPSFEISTGSDSETVKFTAALGWNFEPQNTYEFTITINSLYVQIDVEATQWEDGGENSTIVGNPKKWTIQFPLEDNANNRLLEWEEIKDINGTIG